MRFAYRLGLKVPVLLSVARRPGLTYGPESGLPRVEYSDEDEDEADQADVRSQWYHEPWQGLRVANMCTPAFQATHLRPRVL